MKPQVVKRKFGRTLLNKVDKRVLTKEDKRRNADRAAQMAAMRPQYTLKKIGQKWGMTYERVRQVLKAHGYGDLLPFPKERIQKFCPECSIDFGLTRGVETTKRKRFCSPKCRTFYTSTHLNDYQRNFVNNVLRLRKKGNTWREVSTLLGVKHHSSMPRDLRRNAAKENIDVSAAFGFMIKGGKRWKMKPRAKRAR